MIYEKLRICTQAAVTFISKLVISPKTHLWRLKGERIYSSYSFKTPALDGVSGQRHAPAVLYHRGKNPGTNCTGGWVGLRAGLDTEDREKSSCLCRGSNPDRPVVQSVARHCTA
jgi:hypothetical protein